MWANNYIGIPFKYKGRTKEGLDCWGLARLIYQNEYSITLPSLSDNYEDSDVERIADLIAQYKEGWESSNEPSEGDVVLFRVMGNVSHIGVAVSKTHFIHAKEGYDSAVEAFESPYWKKRIVGYFKYSQNKNAILNAVPHPLRTQRYTVPIPSGTNLEQLANWIIKEYSVADIKSNVNIIVNGRIIDKAEWSNVTLLDNDVVEYRSVATGGDTTRMLLTLAVMYVAYMVVGPAAAGSAGYGGTGAMTATQAGAAFAASTATVYVGMRMVDYIAPIRMPDMGGNDSNSAERQLMMNGGQNRVTPYGAIPVVLGKVRVTPPLGSVNYLTYENERDSYLSMLLTWGYGPLTIYENTFRIGEQALSNYTDYTLINLDRKTTETSLQLSQFNAIYGNDITQTNPNLVLVCDGNPEVPVTAGPWAEAISSERVDSLTVAIHFPQGLRKIKVKGDRAGDSFAAPTSFDLAYYYGGSWHALTPITVGSDAPKKDAFTFTKTFNIYGDESLPINSGLSIRVRRTTGDNTEDNPDYRYSNISILQSVTFVRNAMPALDPLGCKLAKSAFKIKATDQLNGSIEGVNAVVQTYCKAWNGSAWIDSSTSNPAALFRYVLEHPANSQKITNPAAKFDLVQLQHWSAYCDAHGFKYNAVLGAQRSVLEVLRDICAAGRASPAMLDGKWTVTIDEEKPNVIQHFSPHNSWGFESTKALPKLPDGLRVTYFDEDNEYQESEIIVYSIGKNASNASLFEAIQLPGVTNKTAVIDHARWHMAQAKLRPEIYTLNADIEYLVCNRGDRVKVAHDIPMWGLGSGRVKNKVSNTVLMLDEDLPMKSSTTYTIRFRSADGSSVVRNLVPVTLDGYYSEITLASAVTDTEVNVSDLFLFGELNSESQDLIVLNIEPTTNKSARLTLVDYGVTSTYNIFNDYLTLTENIAFETQITLPPRLLIESLGNYTPIITGLTSDESVMEKISAGAFKYNLKVSYVNSDSLPSSIASVQVQYDYAASTDGLNYKISSTDYSIGSINVPDVSEGEAYKVRLRYVTLDGRFGKWSDWVQTVIVGKTSLPSPVTNFIITPEYTTGKLRLTWDSNTEIDIKGYEVRTQNAGWGTNNNRIFLGNSTTCSTFTEDSLHTTTYYIRAFDYNNNYSASSTSLTFTSPNPSVPTNLSYIYGTTSATHSSVTFSWIPPVSTYFTVKEYEVTISRPNQANEVLTTAATRYTTNADWLGNATLSIKAVDTIGNLSTAAQLTVPKYAPNPVTSFTTEVVDNNVLLRWVLPTKTSLPISHVLIKRGETWGTADKVIGEKSGTFTSIFELVGGDYIYWLAVVDTDGRESTAVPIPVKVSQPPDFVFNAEWNSTWTGTKTNTSNVINSTSLLMLVDTAKTWATHFTSRSWASPQAQITAGYPLYAQPTIVGNASYVEVFDYGQLLASSSITVSHSGIALAGSPTNYIQIETSIDGITWSTPEKTSAIFATNFSKIRVSVIVTAYTDKDLFELQKLVVRLDNKQVSDSGSVDALSTDSLGTIVNFNKELIDVQSVTLSPLSTTPLTAVYDLHDNTIGGTYSITSGVCTINATGHSLETGQNVRLSFTSGSATNGTYTVTKITANQYTVSVIGQANTSGNVITYPQSMRVYVFNSTTGTRQSAKVSWQIRGY